MAERDGTGPGKRTGLARAFEAWWLKERDARQFVLSALVALDANVLLHLYRVTPATRDQILSVFHELGDRLWVPHQAALEFHRNRTGAVMARTSQFRETKRSLEQAAANALLELQKALSKLDELRLANMTERTWTPESQGLDEGSLKHRLKGVMDPALAELAALEAEHDLLPGNLRSGDPILESLEDITPERLRLGPPR